MARTQSDESFEISVYDGTLTPAGILQNIERLKKAFPALPGDYYDILSERIKEIGFNDARLRDAISHVIDTCVYPMPAVASIVSFNRMMKVYDYEGLIAQVNNGCKISSFVKVDMGTGRPLWVKKTDFELHGRLKVWETKSEKK